MGVVPPRSIFRCSKCGYEEIGPRYRPAMECPKCKGTMKNQHPEFKKVY
jgi:predicted Zn-ribbon and HTH transcriptional regulator